MPDFDPFDMDMDGDVDGVDFLGFDQLVRHIEGSRGHPSAGPADAVFDLLTNAIGLGTLLMAMFICVATLWDVPGGNVILSLVFVLGIFALVFAAGEFVSRSGKPHCPRDIGEPPVPLAKASELSPVRGHADQRSAVSPRPSGEREGFADTYEERVRQWKERADRLYGLPTSTPELRQDEWRDRDKDELADVADRFNTEVDSLMYGAEGLEQHEQPYRFPEEPPWGFYDQWAAEYDDFDAG